MLVTDIKRTVYKGLKNEHELTGFYMDKYLTENLDSVPKFLSKSWDCVGIVSGHGKVRIGKSTLASQVCFYLAWLLAGGEMGLGEDGKAFVSKFPTKKVRFELKENVVFSAESLQETAQKLYDKYGKNQVILYDEGRQGLDSARAMESINKGMEDFFQECGFMGHVIIIVLPSFFKLHEDYAVARSLFLIDAFADKKFDRGFFNFYNEHQKELLYFFGKKKLGATAKYRSANESFWGRFTKWLPFDKDEYEMLKKEELSKKRRTRRQKNLQIQRDFLFWRLRKIHKEKYEDVLNQMSEIVDVEMGKRAMQTAVQRINDIIAKSKGLF